MLCVQGGIEYFTHDLGALCIVVNLNSTDACLLNVQLHMPNTSLTQVEGHQYGYLIRSEESI